MEKYHNKPRHLRAVPTPPPEVVPPVEDGIREGIKKGNLAPDVGEACIKAYRDNVYPLGLRLREPPELGWELPDDAA